MTTTTPSRVDERATGPTALSRLPRSLRREFDVGVLVLFAVVSFLVRRGNLPTDGLWFDDSWVAAGAMQGSPRQLLVVGSGHPGFTAVLMGVDRLGGGLAALAVPSLVAGVVAAPLLYLGLRSFGYERALSALLGAALVVAPIHIVYSGRVKGYTLDTVVVLLLGIALPVLARRTWRWPLAAAWTIAAVGIGLLSGYALVATAGAGLVLALHPASDRALRVVAVGVQAVIQGAYLMVAQSKTDLAGIEEVMEVVYDGHITFSWNPVTFGGEVLTHLGRVAEVFPARPDGWLAVLAVVAVVGMVLASVRGRRRAETIAGRYFSVLVAVAFVGGVSDRFPFGPTNLVALSPGGRHTLWLVSAMAFGLAAVGHRMRGLVARREPLRFAFDGVALLLAAGVLVAGYGPAPGPPLPGTGSAAAFVARSIGPDDVVLVPGSSLYSFSVNVDTPVTVAGTPDHQIGFAPVFRDPRIHAMGGWATSPGTPEEVRAWIADADRVFVVVSGYLGSDAGARQELEQAGFTGEVRSFGGAVVTVWSR